MDSRLVLPVNSMLDGGYRILRVVGAGGFGITYEAEDINLGTMVAIKEYYPVDFGDRDNTMSVRPKSERHKPTFDKGRSNFLEEARTLARFEHPSIVRVSRVFEANSTAYMVMRFEQGMSFGDWLRSLQRPPTQEELDSLIAPLLDALDHMHAANLLHRDIAPDNIVVRADGTPVLLDFGAARRAVAEMSRSLTGIVKAGYSPHEQYATDGRLQGPWSDLYAFGATLYRAVTGKHPEESMLRVDEDRMVPATQAAKGKYRRDFLAAIDACLKVRHSERPRSVAQVRPMLLGRNPQTKATERLAEPTYRLPGVGSQPQPVQSTQRQARRRWPAVAALVAILGGSYAGYEYQRLHPTTPQALDAQMATAVADAGARPRSAGGPQQQAALDAETQLQKAKEAAAALQRQIEEERRRKELSEAQQRQSELAEALRRKQQADAAEAEARRKMEAATEQKRKEEAYLAALEEARRKDEAAAENRRTEEIRIATLEDARRSEEKRKEDERLRLAAIPDDDKRVEFVRKIQGILKRNSCYGGDVDGRGKDTQEGLNRFVQNASNKGISKPARIDLAKASVGDFESWLRDAEAINAGLCAPAKPIVREEKSPPAAKTKVTKAAPERQEKAQRAPTETRAAVRDPEACFNRCHAAGGRRGGANVCNRKCSGG